MLAALYPRAAWGTAISGVSLEPGDAQVPIWECSLRLAVGKEAVSACAWQGQQEAL